MIEAVSHGSGPQGSRCDAIVFLAHDQHGSLGLFTNFLHAVLSLVIGAAPLRPLSRHFRMSSIRLPEGLPGWQSPSTVPNINVLSKRLPCILQMVSRQLEPFLSDYVCYGVPVCPAIFPLQCQYTSVAAYLKRQ